VAISVDANGDFAIGFSASGPNNYASAYYEAYKYNATSKTWTLETPTLLAGGVASYYRTFGGGANRWGDFSSVVPDPSSPSTFWVFNEFAWTQGTTIYGESGRWATQVGEFTLPNTITGPVVASAAPGLGLLSSSTNPSPSIANLALLAQAGEYAGRQPSDINPNANPLVEADHGPGLGTVSSQVAGNFEQLAQTGDFENAHASDINAKANPLHEADQGPGIGSVSSQVAGSFSQLVQTMAGFGGNHEGIAALSGAGENDLANPAVLAANLFHHHA